MGKKITFTPKPAPADALDAFVGAGQATPTTAPETDASASGTTKRLTLDLPEALHRRIKVSCAERGTKMVDEIRALLEKHFA